MFFAVFSGSTVDKTEEEIELPKPLAPHQILLSSAERAEPEQVLGDFFSDYEENTVEEQVYNYKFRQTLADPAVEMQVYAFFSDIPELIEVARCESTFRHSNSNGNVLRGNVNRSDVGVMQINEFFHLKTAEKLGIDIHSLEGNLAYARYLYEKEGLRPWNASRPCWGKYVSKIN